MVLELKLINSAVLEQLKTKLFTISVKMLKKRVKNY